jgi:hypothetical protein
MKIGEMAAGRSGDKGDTLDLTIVAYDEEGYQRLKRMLTPEYVRSVLNRVVPGPVQRYEVPNVLALKFVAPEALPGGVQATLHAGLHWQKAAIWLLLDLELQ